MIHEGAVELPIPVRLSYCLHPLVYCPRYHHRLVLTTRVLLLFTDLTSSGYWPHVFLEETSCLEDRQAIGICSFLLLAGSLIYNHG